MKTPVAVRDLQGEIAPVSTAMSGTGRATAMQRAAQGATLIGLDRDLTHGVTVVAEIENSGGSARFVGAHVTEPMRAPFPVFLQVPNQAELEAFAAARVSRAMRLAVIAAARAQLSISAVANAPS